MVTAIDCAHVAIVEIKIIIIVAGVVHVVGPLRGLFLIGSDKNNNGNNIEGGDGDGNLLSS